jgi:exosortase K
VKWPVRALIAGAVALGFKLVLARQPVEGLRWLLAPTSWLTSLATGHPFVWEAGVGYSSVTARFSIVTACAGVTFFSVALGLLLFHALARPRLVPLAVGGAFVATVLANTVRLVGCVWLHVDHWRLGNLSEAELHRLIGLAVYTSALVMLALLVGGRSRAGVGLALGWYLAVTLALPFLRGAAGPDFGAHALWTLVVVVPIGGLVMLALRSRPQATAAETRSRGNVSPAPPSAGWPSTSARI